MMGLMSVDVKETVSEALSTGRGGVAFKYQWDETALRMYLRHETVQRLFPEFEFEEFNEEAVAERRNRGLGVRPSYLVQVMQSAGSVFVENQLDAQLVVPATIVQSTTASDLAIPIETFVPTAVLKDIPSSRLAMLLLHADSVSANKLVVQFLAMLIPDVPVQDALCYGHQCDLTEGEVLRALNITNPMHATKKLWSTRKSREGFLTEVDALIDKARRG